MSRRDFTAGYALACANLARYHGEDCLAEYLIEEAGFRFSDFVKAKLDDDDLETLRPICVMIEARERNRRAASPPAGGQAGEG